MVVFCVSIFLFYRDGLYLQVTIRCFVVKRFIIGLVIPLMWSACQNEVPLYEDTRQIAHNGVSTIRTPQEAIEVAQQALLLLEGKQIRSGVNPVRQVDLSAGVEVVKPHATRSAVSPPVMYAVNFKNGAGYALVAASRLEEPLLAVTEQGTFKSSQETGIYPLDRMIRGHEIPKPGKPMEKVPDSLLVLHGLSRDTIQGDYPCNWDLYYYYHPQYEVKEQNPVLWGQGSPLGDYAPNSKAGCVTTALAIGMHYCKRPSEFETYMHRYREIFNMNWRNMTSLGMSSKDSASLRVLGHEIRTLGMAHYYPNVTGISTHYIPTILRHFGFSDKPLRYRDIDMIERALWGFHSPKIYLATCEDVNSNDNLGHAWIIDGYMHKAEVGDPYSLHDKKRVPWVFSLQKYLHINWGWDGAHNGYFSEGLINVRNPFQLDDNAGSSQRNYTYSTENARFYVLRASALDNIDLTYPISDDPDDPDE